MSWDLAGGVAVVTGAASGIGRALALRLARENTALALGDVHAQRLKETAREARQAGVVVTAHALDVSDLRQMQRFAEEVLAAHGRVSLLANNAGVALHGTFEEVSLEEFDWVMRTNFYGVLYGTKTFLPLLRREQRAHIVNMSSLFGIIAPAGQAAYCASKFAIRGFTQALRHELEGSNVGVSCVYPGGIRTRIAAEARVAAGMKSNAAAMVAGFDRLARHSPELVAKKIVSGVKRNKARIMVGGDSRLIAALERLAPARYWGVLKLGLRSD